MVDAAMISLGQAVTVEVVKRHPTGGGVVSLPVLVESTIDLARTAGGGEGDLNITKADLQQMVANFKVWPGPVPITISPHRGDDETAGPMPGFIESMSVAGNTLWAMVDLNAFLFDLVIEQRAFRGFSVDLSHGATRPTIELDGWAVTGGVFTNRPATDVNFKVAAEVGVYSVTVPLQDAPRGQETSMSENTISLASHEAKVAELQAEVNVKAEAALAANGQLEAARQEANDLRAERDTANSKLSALTTDHTALKATSNVAESQVKSLKTANKALEGRVTELASEVTLAQSVNLAIQVKEVIIEAVEAGVPPAMFEGHDADPAEWMNAKYASLEAFKEVVTALSGVVPKSTSTPVKSGADAKPSDPEKNSDLSAETQEKLDSLNLSAIDYGGVTTEAEARKIWEANQKKD